MQIAGSAEQAKGLLASAVQKNDQWKTRIAEARDAGLGTRLRS